MTTPSPLIEAQPGGLAVLLKQPVRASNGQEFLAGMVAGFSPRSAVRMVVAGIGSAYLHHDTAREWAKTLAGAGVTVEQANEMISGPYAVELQRQQMIAEEEAALAREEEAALEAKKKLEAELAEADRLALEAKQKADEVIPHSKDATLTEAPASAGADAEAVVEQPEPAAEPPAPAPTTKRGNKTPR